MRRAFRLLALVFYGVYFVAALLALDAWSTGHALDALSWGVFGAACLVNFHLSMKRST